MKKVLFLLPALLLSLTLVQAQGIQFEQDKWDDILAAAKEQNKLIFVDAYTTWCGPCKKMTKEIFPEEKVGNFFNKHFINVKMDMEKGEGPQMAQRYSVMVYPTLLFIAGDGTLVHRTAGFHNLDQFLELGNIAIDPSRRMSAMDERYAKGDRDPEFLYAYTLSRYEAMDGSHAQIAEEYMASQSDWSTLENMNFVFAFTNSTESKMFEYLIEHRDRFIQVFGQREVTARLQELIYNSVYDSKEKSSLEQVDELFARAYPEKAEQLSSSFRMTYYRQAGDRDNYAKAAINYFKKYDNNPDELNEAAWTFFRVIKDKKMLKKAIKWSKRSIKLDDNYYNNDTLAALYAKTGKKKKAIKAARRAIGIAESAGIDHSETDKLLKDLLGDTGVEM